MAVVCPTVTAFNLHEYRSQIELLEPFAKRLHIDLMDGEFAPTKSPDLETIWWPDGIRADIHLMYKHPAAHLEQLIKLKPALVIIHYEAEVDHADFAAKLKNAGIKAGLALLKETSASDVQSVLPSFDHVMIFSGNLGYHGGSAVDLSLLDKVRAIHDYSQGIEIGWDGGISDQNAGQLVKGGISVLNVGGFIHKAPDSKAAYAKLETVIGTL